MKFTKWRYKSGHTPPDDPKRVMADLADGSLVQLTFGPCPYKSDVEDDNTPCWCTEIKRDDCAEDV